MAEVLRYFTANFQFFVAEIMEAKPCVLGDMGHYL